MVNLYLLGKKGFISLINIPKDLLSSIGTVIIGTDINVIHDYSIEIEAFLIENTISYVFHKKQTEQINKLNKLSIAIGWRWMIHDENPIIVFHDSILPKYRGFNPLVSALINGDEKIGVSALFGNSEFDRGEIIGQEIVVIDYPIKIKEAIELLSEAYSKLLNSILQRYFSNTITSTPQDEKKATYSLWRDEEDYFIDWSQDSDTILRTIHALGYPYKGAMTKVGDMEVKIFDAQIIMDVTIENRVCGKVLFKNENSYTIVCGKGLLEVSHFYDESGNEINFNNKYRIRFKNVI